MTSISGKFKQLGKNQKAVWIAFLFVISGFILAFQNVGQEEYGIYEKEQRWQKLVKEKETIHLQWLRTLNPFIKKTEGDLLWNTNLQEGLMRFIHLPRIKDGQNYHLWIYDLHQPQQKPISAGIFTLGKVVNHAHYVPIVPEQKIGIPYKFLLTLEKKGNKVFTKSQSLLLAQP